MRNETEAYRDHEQVSRTKHAEEREFHMLAAIRGPPYREWRRSLGVVVMCPRCRADLAVDDSGPCAGRERVRRANGG